MSERVEIDGLAYGGDGVGRLADGRVVFVPGTCPGDLADVQLQPSRGKERFARGKVLGLESASAHRVAPSCDEATTARCGGCPWAHIAYDEQLVWKRRAVVDAFERIAKVADADGLVEDCVPSKRQWHYRNKIELEVGQDVAGRFTLGMHAAQGAFDPLATCELCAKKLRKTPKALTGALRFLQRGEDLGIVRVGVRCSDRTGDVEIAVWTRTGRFPRAQAAKVLTDALQVKKPGVVRVLLKSTPKERKIAGVESLAGHSRWAENVYGRQMLLSAPSFFQVNTAGAETLIDLVLDALDVDGLDTVLDLYCGAGTFTLPLAERAMAVTGVEAEGSSVRDLRQNLERNELFAEVVGGDVARQLPELGVVDKAVVDPPRSGLSPKAADALVACGAQRLAYVSCDPVTLARDLVRLCAEGPYHLEKATPVDLFPQTYHVETVAVLAR